MLYKLLSRTDRNRFNPAVWCLTDDGPIAKKIRALDIPVVCVGMRRGLPDAASVLRLAGQLRAFKPDIAQTWLYHADLAGGVAARLAKVRRVVWNIRNSAFDPAHAKSGTVRMAHTAARLSSVLPDAILCCSDVARQEHIKIGYAAQKFTVMPNGFDVATLRPDPAARTSVREELKLPQNALLVGLVARFDPQKDHKNFFKAALLLRQTIPNAYFVCCGDGVSYDNTVLYDLLAELGIGGATRLLGRRTDVARLNAAFDVAVSASRYGEGFPNVIGEAMACGVPCVVTESGDGPFVVGETGRVVPPANEAALASAIGKLLALPEKEKAALGRAARERIVKNFEIGLVAEKYAAFYENLVAGGGAANVSRQNSNVREGA